MTKIKIEKINEEITYQNITTTSTFMVNGKEVRVYNYDIQDNQQSNYEADQTVDENDLDKLTDLEHEIFGENLSEWLELKVGKSKTEKVDEDFNPNNHN